MILKIDVKKDCMLLFSRGAEEVEAIGAGREARLDLVEIQLFRPARR